MKRTNRSAVWHHNSMDQTHADVCLLILFGLPGSGKTTLARKLVSYSKEKYAVRCTSVKPLCFQHVCYDEIFPPDLEKNAIEQVQNKESNDTDSKWKEYRKCIKQCVEYHMERKILFDKSLASNKITHGSSLEPPDATILNRFESCLSVLSGEQGSESETSVGKYVYIIDDNMYYTSMRYEYVQLARKFEISYAQIYVSSSVDSAKERNKKRPQSEQVSNDTIITMATRLEPPSPAQSWQKHSLTWDTDKDQNLDEIINLVQRAFSDPVLDLEGDLEGMRSASRVACSASFLHQSDQILRKLIADHMMKAKSSNKTKQELKAMATSVNRKRNEILAHLKNKQILIPSECEHYVTDACKDTKHPLYLYLLDLFKVI